MLQYLDDLLVDKNNRELTRHGNTAFPVACYDDDIHSGVFPWHWHEELETGIVSEGTVQICIGTQTHVLCRGDGFFVNSGQLHRGQDACPGSSSGCRNRSVVFHPRLVGGSRESIFYQKYVLPVTENASLEGCFLRASVPWEAQALQCVETVWQSCLSSREGYELAVRDSLSRLLFLLVQNLSSQQTHTDGKALRDAERIKQMLQFIDGHYAEGISTADIARSASISESECLRCFHAAIGTTPIRYLREYRIDRAARLLGTGHVRAQEAADACGFQDAAYFTRTFRELKGCTPGEYVRRMREQDGKSRTK